MKFLTKACFGMLLAASALSTPAFAQEEEASGPVSLSGGISVVSDYRFRGISLSNEKVALQSTLTVSHESGFYAGVWGSTLPDSPLYGKYELDLYGGFATEIAPGTTVDIGAIYYVYPGNQDFAGPSDYIEIVGKLSHDIGPVSATGMVAYAPDQNSLGSDDNIYLNLGLGYGIPETPVTLTAGLGIFCLAAGLQGWLRRAATPVERALLLGAAAALISPSVYTDMAGVGLLAVALALQMSRRSAEPVHAVGASVD